MRFARVLLKGQGFTYPRAVAWRFGQFVWSELAIMCKLGAQKFEVCLLSALTELQHCMQVKISFVYLDLEIENSSFPKLYTFCNEIPL